ncbi:MAG: hypothetical protein M3552_14200 [Planctomycetota bacterium]|nr:hypothetical protein [Planctomycetota bacterium]
MPRFQGWASASTWAYRVALNTAIDWRRKQRRGPSRRRPAPAVGELPCAEPDGTGQVIQREAVARLYTAIRRLPDTDAALVLLYLVLNQAFVG